MDPALHFHKILWYAIGIKLAKEYPMVRFKQKFDSSGKIYFPKILREAPSGFAPELTIAPNTKCAVVYPSGLSSKEVLESLKVIQKELSLSADREKRAEAKR